MILFTVHIPKLKTRKHFAPKTKVIANKKLYNRKQKHRKNQLPE